ncbi:MAG: MgtC/SapB family protein [Deltaproteobacteria bacterium]|nr:MgtC/SapB family protein [Deltaproteobacteria bacterium]
MEVVLIDWPTGLLRVGAAAVAGALVGLEREMTGKAAGFRTNILIAVGAALATVVGLTIVGEHAVAKQVVGDPSRVPEGIVTGIGFLGAGAILQKRGSVRGLTTAATIWLLGAIGIALGAGLYAVGAGATVLAMLVLVALGRLEGRLDVPDTTVEYELWCADGVGALAAVRRRADDAGVRLYGLKVRGGRDATWLHLMAQGTDSAQDAFASAVKPLLGSSPRRE